MPDTRTFWENLKGSDQLGDRSVDGRPIYWSWRTGVLECGIDSSVSVGLL